MSRGNSWNRGKSRRVAGKGLAKQVKRLKKEAHKKARKGDGKPKLNGRDIL